ncbi:hypothetical protein ABT294_29485 [Nonomuraea sp. NPDC000554]|uniref:hypothetical protein n=1 Tax=Nonomuraea sp. NPDC000554 TaxID=3154259 RepID=UPI0033309732
MDRAVSVNGELADYVAQLLDYMSGHGRPPGEALDHARAHPGLASPYTIERIPPETRTLWGSNIQSPRPICGFTRRVESRTLRLEPSLT